MKQIASDIETTRPRGWLEMSPNTEASGNLGQDLKMLNVQKMAPNSPLIFSFGKNHHRVNKKRQPLCRWLNVVYEQKLPEAKLVIITEL